ncbi:MAG TPA: hypothetical protein VD837_10190, partial [Terriglobales bacterium]|nr:hypothetical protein [Terriglobales bacterium]
GRSIGLYTPPAARIGVVQRTSLSTLKSCKNTEPTPKKGGFVSSLSPVLAAGLFLADGGLRRCHG